MHARHPLWRREAFWKSFFFLLPIFSNLKLLPNTVFDLFLGLIAVLVLAKPIRKDLLFWVMGWMAVVYFWGLFLEPTGSDAFLSCLRYLVVAGIVVCLNGNIAFNQETARYYIWGSVVLSALFAGSAWLGFRFAWEIMWMQKWLFCGPSFLCITLMAAFSASVLFYKALPNLFMIMFGIVLFAAPVMESRVMDYFSGFAIVSSLIPLTEFLKNKKHLFILGLIIIYASIFQQTVLLKKIGLFPYCIESIQINPFLKAKERLNHDSFFSKYDTDRKTQIKKVFHNSQKGFDLFGLGGMQHQKIHLTENQGPQSSILRPVGILIQKTDGGILLVALMIALLLSSIWQTLKNYKADKHFWKSLYLFFFLLFAFSMLFITNPTGSFQWWLFISPQGFFCRLNQNGTMDDVSIHFEKST